MSKRVKTATQPTQSILDEGPVWFSILLATLDPKTILESRSDAVEKKDVRGHNVRFWHLSLNCCTLNLLGKNLVCVNKGARADVLRCMFSAQWEFHLSDVHVCVRRVIREWLEFQFNVSYLDQDVPLLKIAANGSSKAEYYKVDLSATDVEVSADKIVLRVHVKEIVHGLVSNESQDDFAYTDWRDEFENDGEYYMQEKDGDVIVQHCMAGVLTHRLKELLVCRVQRLHRFLGDQERALVDRTRLATERAQIHAFAATST